MYKKFKYKSKDKFFKKKSKNSIKKKDDIIIKDDKLFCYKHNLSAETYCINHNILCCIECIVHDKHQFDEILNIEQSVDFIKKNLKSVFDNSNLKIEEIREKIQEKVKNKEKKLNKFNLEIENLKTNIKNVINKVKEYEKDFIEQVEVNKNMINNEFNININILNQYMNKLLNFNKDYDSMITTNSNILINYYVFNKNKFDFNFNLSNIKNNKEKLNNEKVCSNKILTDISSLINNNIFNKEKYLSPKKYFSSKNIKIKENSNINYNINFFPSKVMKRIESKKILTSQFTQDNDSIINQNLKFKMFIKDIKNNKTYKYLSNKKKLLQIKNKKKINSTDLELNIEKKKKYFDILIKIEENWEIKKLDIFNHNEIIYYINKQSGIFKSYNLNNKQFNNYNIIDNSIFDKLFSYFFTINNKIYLICIIKKSSFYDKIYKYDFEKEEWNFIVNLEAKNKINIVNYNENIIISGDIKNNKFGFSIFNFNIYSNKIKIIMENSLRLTENYIKVYEYYLIIFEGGKYSKNCIKVIDYFNNIIDEFQTNWFLEEFNVSFKFLNN